MSLFGTVRTYLEMIRFAHTLFALPFAFMGAVLAAGGIPSVRTLAWILAAMVGARSGAMGVNRLADRHQDAANPRTRDRALPQGRITPAAALVFSLAAFGLFLLAAWQLNPLCFALAPLAIFIVSGYSYTKRFTSLSHLVLGLCLALAPIGAWIAVTGRLTLAPVVLGAAVLFWVAGFDILYALLDVEFDRRTGLFSIPARLGVPAALWLARLFHLLTLLGLLLLIPLLGLGWAYRAGLVLAAALLTYEHLLLARHGLKKLDVAFFNVNGVLSVAMLLATLADLLLPKL
ncbi:MAG: UbiA-like polyprenyltransferase [Candidatus Methylomirabilales bacterium]